MKKSLFIVATASLAFGSTAIAEGNKSVTARGHSSYIYLEESPNSLLILPPPPSFDSVDFLRDKAMYDWGKAQRTTPRGKVSYYDADVNEENLAKGFTPAFGYEISKKNTPEIYKLMGALDADSGDLATRAAKQHYNRVRPFAFSKEATCRPEDEKELSTNGSYPSGHTTTGWAIALVLAEINPARQNEILKRGHEMGVSRVICGYHWQSDIEAGRLVASASVNRLHAAPDFQLQMQKAKDEFKTLAGNNPQFGNAAN